MPIPLHTLPRPERLSEQPNELLYWGVDIPPELDADRIVVSKPELEATLHTAGMQNAVATPTSEGVSGYTRSARGSAAYFNVHYTPEDMRRTPGMRWPTLEVALSTQMLAAHALSSAETGDTGLVPTGIPDADTLQPPGKPANKEAQWARAADLALRQSIRAGARETRLGIFVDERQRIGALAMLTANICNTTLLATGSVLGLTILPFTLGANMYTRYWMLRDNKLRTGKYEPGRMHWNISGGDSVAPEMYAATVVSTAVPGLIRARK